MSPIASFFLLSINLLTFGLSFSVLMLAVWQNPGTPLGRALNTFLASLVLLNLTVIGVLVTQLLGNGGNGVSTANVVFSNLSLFAFSLSTLTAFALIVTAAGLMKQAFQVISRAGMVALLLLQWPLWNGNLFTVAPTTQNALQTYNDAGLVAAAFEVVYIVMGLTLAVRYRRRIGQPALLISTGIAFSAQFLALLFPFLRAISFPSLVASLVAGILGYSLVRLQLFNPLMMRTAQLAAVRDLSQAVTHHQELDRVLDTVAQQARVLLNTGAVVISLTDGVKDNGLVIAAQSGNITSVIGRRLAPGEGLAGRVLQTQQTMSLANYRAWDGRSPVFADLPLYASMSVPLIDDEETLGVLTIHELEPGRIYTERDRAVVEMLVSQATLGIIHARLHHEVDHWRQQTYPPEANYQVVPDRRTPGGAFGDLVARLIDSEPATRFPLVINIPPGLPGLPLPVSSVQKMITEALDQVAERATGTDTLTVMFYADYDNLLVEVRCTPYDERSHTMDRSSDSVRIRLEKRQNP